MERAIHKHTHAHPKFRLNNMVFYFDSGNLCKCQRDKRMKEMKWPPRALALALSRKETEQNGTGQSKAKQSITENNFLKESK